MVPFTLSAADVWPGCHEIAIDGELDLAAVGELEAALDGAIARRVHVLLDMTACDFIDAGTLAALVRAHERLRQRGRRLSLFGVRGQVRRLLSLTGLLESELCLAAARRPAYRHRMAALPVP
jgi:anti-sigma B factor antagonist